ncbi:hypothetical protein EYB25_003228 [Talaromyces marneffei]|uniref:Uncharacterized protein n=1 Tax=Talaromyces marneffei PM1 TaxID=1077442 RepID=A0A093VJM2_TALMA|nr:hypothetical protein EYB25_003228 [Talaromyces marneffei]
MSQSIRKITIFALNNDEILETVKSEGIYDELATVRWITVHIGQETEPPDETIAVVVDLTTSRGAVRFYDKSTDSQIGGVYMEDSSQTLIPWDNHWWFRVSGSPRIAYIERK